MDNNAKEIKDQQQSLASYEVNPLTDDLKPKLTTEALLYVLLGCVSNPDYAKLIADKNIDFSTIVPLLRVLAPAFRQAAKALGML